MHSNFQLQIICNIPKQNEIEGMATSYGDNFESINLQENTRKWGKNILRLWNNK